MDISNLERKRSEPKVACSFKELHITSILDDTENDTDGKAWTSTTLSRKLTQKTLTLKFHFLLLAFSCGVYQKERYMILEISQ